MFEEMVDLEYSKSEKYENIRVFTAALESSTVPLYDLKSVMEKWSRPSPGKNFMCDCVHRLLAVLLFHRFSYHTWSR